MGINPSQLGTEVRRIRESRGISRNDLAVRTGVGKTALFDLEHGNPGVRLNTLLAVLHELDMDLDLQLPNAEPAASEPPPPPQPASPGPSPDLPEHLL